MSSLRRTKGCRSKFPVRAKERTFRTTALHLVLLAVGVSAGDEVIMVDRWFIATANAVRYFGAIPIFIDFDEKRASTWIRRSSSGR